LDESRERELDKRAEDIRAVRRLMALADDISLIHPWAFFAWAGLVAAGTVLHYARFLSESIQVNSALLSIWLPVLVLGAVAESLSWIIKLRTQALPIFSRRLGGMLLGALAMITVLIFGGIKIAQAAPSPGIIIVFAVLPLVFYAQMCYGQLFIEIFAGLAAGILLDALGLSSPALFLAGGLFVAAVFAASGLHVLAIERRRRG
jgi:hypothetical protein